MARRDRQITGREGVLIPALGEDGRGDGERGAAAGAVVAGTGASRVSAAAGQLLRRLRPRDRDGGGRPVAEGDKV